MKLRVGCHLSSAGGFLKMGKTAASIGANTFQFFTRNPRGSRAKALDPEDIRAFLEFAEEQDIRQILAHAPYTLNAASGTPMSGSLPGRLWPMICGEWNFSPAICITFIRAAM